MVLLPRFIKQGMRKILARFGFSLFSFDPRTIKNEFKWLRDLNINTVIDIGAHFGESALRFHEIFPDADIYSFEPLASAAKEMKKACAKLPRHRIFQVALSDADREVKFFENVGDSRRSSLLPFKAGVAYDGGAAEHVIKTVRLDDILIPGDLRKNILVKMDTEGSENKIIRGGQKFLREAKVIISEVHFESMYEDQCLFDEVYRLLLSLGFSYKGSFQELAEGHFRTAKGEDSENVREDAVFLHG